MPGRIIHPQLQIYCLFSSFPHIFSTVFSLLVPLNFYSLFLYPLQKHINVSLAQVFKSKFLPQWKASAFSVALTGSLIALGQQIPGPGLWGWKREREQQHILEQQTRYAWHCTAYCQRLWRLRGHELSLGVKFSWGCVSKIHYFFFFYYWNSHSQISE